ncbi:MAG: hypothetical protein ABS84_15965 [Rubrivivax sp. SCN 71-131]|nr:MAG: hypothetical protein ABS84_15965 [Rubrivivax sp. SCN 71-131]
MSAPLSQQIAVAAAQLVVDDGLEYDSARRKAAQAFGGRRLRPSDLPRNEAIEDEVHAYIAIFHAETQGLELRALRELAWRWMKRLQDHRPHLAGAVWRGTATRLSAILIDLYCDDPKSAEIDLLNQGIAFDAGTDLPGADTSKSVLTIADRSETLGETVTLHLVMHDLDDLRGALRPDARGRSWRGDLVAVQRLLAESKP